LSRTCAGVITLGVKDMNRGRRNSIVPDEANWSYRDVLRNRHVPGLLLGDPLANAGTGMIIVAMPVQTLLIHERVPKAIAIGLVEAAPFVLSAILALAIGCCCFRLRHWPFRQAPASVALLARNTSER
jgi:hypothetical protein